MTHHQFKRWWPWFNFIWRSWGCAYNFAWQSVVAWGSSEARAPLLLEAVSPPFFSHIAVIPPLPPTSFSQLHAACCCFAELLIASKESQTPDNKGSNVRVWGWSSFTMRNALWPTTLIPTKNSGQHMDTKENQKISGRIHTVLNFCSIHLEGEWWSQP